MNFVVEQLRRKRLREINQNPKDRAALERLSWSGVGR